MKKKYPFSIKKKKKAPSYTTNLHCSSSPLTSNLPHHHHDGRMIKAGFNANAIPPYTSWILLLNFPYHHHRSSVTHIHQQQIYNKALKQDKNESYLTLIIDQRERLCFVIH